MQGYWASLGGDEFVNQQRTITYLKNGLAPVGVSVKGDCGCPNIRELLDCPDDPDPTAPYVLPSIDSAPWYDASQPISGDFAGAVVVSVDGWDSVFTRPVNQRLGGGASLGRLRNGARQLTWTAVLYGKSCCAVRYGLSWLTSTLAGTSCAECLGRELHFLECCPQDRPLSHGGDSVAALSAHCDVAPAIPVAPCDAFRVFKNGGLVSGPTITDRRGYSGCGCGCSEILEVQFTIACDPCAFCEPVLLLHAPFPTDVDCKGVFTKIIPPATCPVDPGCPEPITCAEDPNCPPPADPPVYAVADDPCNCDSLFPVGLLATIPAETFGQFDSGVPVIEVYAGDRPLRNVQFRFFENPLGRPCADLDDCFACGGFKVRYVPAFSTIKLDGTTGTVKITCPGNVVETGEAFLVTLDDGVPFDLPVFCCTSYCMKVTAEGFSISPDASVEFSVARRQCPC